MLHESMWISSVCSTHFIYMVTTHFCGVVVAAAAAAKTNEQVHDD